MNNYDKLIDSMVEVMEQFFGDTSPDYWCPELGKEAAHRILDIIEDYDCKDYKENQLKIKSWRASD